VSTPCIAENKLARNVPPPSCYTHANGYRKN
jgi:hypothetical protein